MPKISALASWGRWGLTADPRVAQQPLQEVNQYLLAGNPLGTERQAELNGY